MAIYGTALLAACLLVGLCVGEILGWAVGLNKNIGGVGVAMLLLILACDRLHRTGRLKPPTASGIAFWSAIYIPIVVAMAASQNVLAAIQGGPLALLAGTLSVAACFALVPVINRMGGGSGGGAGGSDNKADRDHAGAADPRETDGKEPRS